MTTALQKKKVLVLNKGWKAISVITLERALVMLFSPCKDAHGKELKDAFGETIPKANIIDPSRSYQDFTWKTWSKLRPKDGEDTIRGTNLVFRVPEIIILNKYDKLPQHQIHFSRRTIYKRDDNRCQYCGCTPGTSELTIDHVLPKSKGGKTTWENCVLACVACNSRKADRAPDRTHIVDHVKDDEGNVKEVYVPAFTVYFDDKSMHKKTIRQPKKPVVSLYKGDIRIESWQNWLGAAYWNTTLENDNGE